MVTISYCFKYEPHGKLCDHFRNIYQAVTQENKVSLMPYGV